MTSFNLSEWAVNNKAIVVFFMLLCAVAGVGAYDRLGRQEDPDFSVQTMVVQVAWPGATVLDPLKQVTDRLEKKLEETPRLDYIKSYTKPGQSTIFVYLKESTPKRDLPDIWYQVRKKVSDIQAALPKGVVGPFFNDEFGDVYGIVYGITYDGFHAAPGARLRRDGSRRVLALAGRRQGRHLRRPAREDLSRLLAAKARQPQTQPR
jgi:multidrug efflux pump subunit AcrB